MLSIDSVRLDGRVVVVTGGGAGIGRGIATNFSSFGAAVAIWERDPERAEESAAACGGLACVADVRDPDQVDAALRTTVERLGAPSVLVNNAGAVFHSSLLETSPNGWDALIRGNLGQVLLCTQRVGREMVAAGAGGSVINITTIEASRAAPGFAAYAAAKAGIENFTRTAALELASHRIRVNSIAPDITATPGMTRMAGAGFEERAAALIPLRRAGHVDDIAGAALYLASDLGAFMTGQTLHVDGGTKASGGWYPHPEHGHYTVGPS